MDHQGPGRRRPATDTRGQASWPWPESGPGQGRSADSGPQAVLGTPTGPQRAAGGGTGATSATGATGARRRIGAETGAQPVLGSRTGGQPTLSGPGSPVRGFPAGFSPEPDQTPPGGFWYPPPEPLTAGPGSSDDTDPIARVEPRPPHTIAVPTGGRRSARP